MKPSTVSTAPEVNVILGPGASIIGDKWFINVTSQQSADLIIDAGPLWGLHPDVQSEIRIAMYGNTTQSTYDNDGEMVFVISSGNQYFAQEISLDSRKKAYRECPSHNEPLLTRNITSMISASTPDRVYRFCNNTEGTENTQSKDYWNKHEVIYNKPLQWSPAMGFNMHNDPIQNELLYEQWDLNGGYSYKAVSRYTSSFLPNQGWKLHISGDSPGTAFFIFQININYYVFSSEPTASPMSPTSQSPSTLYPTSDPTIIPSESPTNEPSTASPISPTSQSPSTLYPTSDPTIIPSSTPTNEPSTDPTTNPSQYPTPDPTTIPSKSPTNKPSTNPTTTKPSKNPSKYPTPFPSDPLNILKVTDIRPAAEQVPETTKKEMYNPSTILEKDDYINNPEDAQSDITVNMLVIAASIFCIMCCVIVILVYLLYTKKKAERQRDETNIATDTKPSHESTKQSPNLSPVNSVNSISIVSDDKACAEIMENEGYHRESDMNIAGNKQLPSEDDPNPASVYSRTDHDIATPGEVYITSKGNDYRIDVMTPQTDAGSV